MNKQNKRKLYTFRHMWIRQALKPANDTRDQALNYANSPVYAYVSGQWPI